jgi:hypothetical protein
MTAGRPGISVFFGKDPGIEVYGAEAAAGGGAGQAVG